ncbi:cysteine--tRNA ligase [candidate division KSB1 bacterium]
MPKENLENNDIMSNDIYIYNTLSRKKELFTPVSPGNVRMYVCGPTVYDYIHIGNARPLIFFDVVRKYLKFMGYTVTFVQNITDIDDKIIRKAVEEEISTEEVAEKYTEAFLDNTRKLNIEPPDESPSATQYVDRMIGLIEGLIERDYAYEVEGNVFFDVSKFGSYGSLSGKDLAQMEVGERVEESVQQQKRDPVKDFALWKTAKPDEPTWDSPWGEGRPGWHTECVVMSTDILGNEFDIHGGGVDLIFPHHENEIAQAKCGLDAGFARYWMHNEFLNIRGEKMSKSLGNTVSVTEVAEQFSAEAIRLFFLQTHYRKQMSLDEELLMGAESAVEKLSRVKQKIDRQLENISEPLLPHPETQHESASIREYRQKIVQAMNDDFNTAKAVGEVFNAVKELEKIAEKFVTAHNNLKILWDGRALLDQLNSFLGIFPFPADLEIVESKIQALIDKRIEFRSAGDWGNADKIRDELLQMGIIIEDTKEGTRWYKK